jgi:hypothetical protein
MLINPSNDQTAVAYTVVLDPLTCDCPVYQQTGKGCVDILAARLLKSNGPVSQWLSSQF